MFGYVGSIHDARVLKFGSLYEDLIYNGASTCLDGTYIIGGKYITLLQTYHLTYWFLLFLRCCLSSFAPVINTLFGVKIWW